MKDALVFNLISDSKLAFFPKGLRPFMLSIPTAYIAFPCITQLTPVHHMSP